MLTFLCVQTAERGSLLDIIMDFVWKNKQSGKNIMHMTVPFTKLEKYLLKDFSIIGVALIVQRFLILLVLCREIIKENIKIDELNNEQKYLFSIAIEKKLFINTEHGFRQNYYFVNRAEHVELKQMSHELYNEVSELIEKAYKLVLDEYLKIVPKHLYWQMGNFLSNYLNHFVTCSLYEADKNGLLSVPNDNNKVWLSLFASE